MSIVTMQRGTPPVHVSHAREKRAPSARLTALHEGPVSLTLRGYTERFILLCPSSTAAVPGVWPAARGKVSFERAAGSRAVSTTSGGATGRPKAGSRRSAWSGSSAPPGRGAPGSGR